MNTIRKMGRSKLGRVKWNLTVPPDLKAAAEALAASEQRAANYMVEDAIKDYLAKHGKPFRSNLTPAKSSRPKPKSP